MELQETPSLAWNDLREEDRNFFVNPHPDVFDLGRARRLVEGFSDEDKNQVRAALASVISKRGVGDDRLLNELKTLHLEIDRHLGWYDQEKNKQ